MMKTFRQGDLLNSHLHPNLLSLTIREDFNLNDIVNQKLEDYKRAQKLVDSGAGEDLHFFLLLFEYQRLSPEERLARGLARGRRKYFIIRK